MALIKQLRSPVRVSTHACTRTHARPVLFYQDGIQLAFTYSLPPAPNETARRHVLQNPGTGLGRNAQLAPPLKGSTGSFCYFLHFPNFSGIALRFTLNYWFVSPPPLSAVSAANKGVHKAPAAATQALKKNSISLLGASR